MCWMIITQDTYCELLQTLPTSKMLQETRFSFAKDVSKT